MVRLWFTNIDDSLSRYPYLFETKPMKISFIKSDDSSDECSIRNNMYSLHKLMVSLPWEGDKRFASAIKPRYQMLFLGDEKTLAAPSDIIKVSVSRKTLSFALSDTRIMCVLHFSFVIHQHPSPTLSSSNLSCYVWYCLTFAICINCTFRHIFIANKWKFSNHSSYWLPCW